MTGRVTTTYCFNCEAVSSTQSCGSRKYET